MRTRRSAAFAIIAVCLAWSGASAAQTSELERAVKATFVYKFAAFVTWPGAAFGGPRSPLRICVLGDGEFAGLVERAVVGQTVGGREISVERLPAPDARCHIAYVADSPALPARQALRELDVSPVLTVTDAASGAAEGIIHLVVEDGRVRFIIDNQAAAERGLTISSKLLSLALHTRRNER